MSDAYRDSGRGIVKAPDQRAKRLALRRGESHAERAVRGRGATRAKPETDAAKVSVNEEGSAATSPPTDEDVTATSPVARTCNRLVARRRYRHFGDASDVQILHTQMYVAQGRPEGRETFRFMFRSASPCCAA